MINYNVNKLSMILSVKYNLTITIAIDKLKAKSVKKLNLV